MASRIVEFTIAADPPPRLDKALSRDVPVLAHLSRTRLVRLVTEGAVRLNGVQVSDARHRCFEGDVVSIEMPEQNESHIAAEDIPLEIIFEDDDLIVVNKRAGMVVHPAPGTPSGTLVNALLHHFSDRLSGVGGERRPGIVHRIDKDTSGLLVVAKTDAAHHGLAQQFERHSVERRYFAVCYGRPDQADPRLHGIRGTSFEQGNILKIQSFLGRHKTDRQRQAVNFDQGRHAVTRARVMQALGRPPAAALLECWLETGRTHQIRVHLAHCGHGLIGDPVYGGRRKLPPSAIGSMGAEAAITFPRQALHATSLGFVHPVTGAKHQFEAPMPDDMQALLDALGAI